MKYDIILADPAWKFSDGLKMSKVKRGASSQYATMTAEQIGCLPIWKLAADNSLLALWCPSSLLKDGLFVMHKWGFAQKQIFTWVKMTKSGGLAFGMGRQFRGCTEHALIGTQGSLKPSSKSERNACLTPALRHSEKPPNLHECLDRMYPKANKLELFARRSRPGWDCIGLECDGPYGGKDIQSWAAEVLG